VGARGWPATLSSGDVGLRPLRVRDTGAWVEVRQANEEWLAPWEGSPARLGPPTLSWEERHTAPVFSLMLRQLRADARAGRALPFAVTWQGRLVGQVTIAGIVRGAFDSAHAGYWVDGRYAGRGIAPTALGLAVDHCFQGLGLHRVEANIRPENTASRRVVEKLGFREEGLHQRYLYIDGGWRDHVCWSVTDDDSSSVLARLGGAGTT
jgi:ribosomal-protein-alanine N-acetyltransferase